MNFHIDDIALNKLIKAKKMANQIIVIGPFLFMIINAWFIYALDLELESSTFLISLIIMTLTTTFICIYIYRHRVRILRKVITKAEVLDGTMKFKTFNHSGTHLVSITGIKIKEQKFQLFRDGLHNAYKIYDNSKQYLILGEYFNNDFLSILLPNNERNNTCLNKK